MAAEAIQLDPSFAVSFHRTLRIPDDEREYPLPPGLGTFPVYRVADYAASVPEPWRQRDGVMLPMYQREALWLGFHAHAWKPYAVKVAVGGINVLTGAAHDRSLRHAPQDYLVCPPQRWLDGVRTERGLVRQFVAVPLGLGGTLKRLPEPAARQAGLELLVFAGQAGVHPRAAQREPTRVSRDHDVRRMGFGEGGRIHQRIYPDPFGIEAWDIENVRELDVHILNTLEFMRVTGQQAPASPIDMHSYDLHGLPWFQLYDEALGDLPGSTLLAHAAMSAHARDLDASPLTQDPRVQWLDARSESEDARFADPYSHDWVDPRERDANRAGEIATMRHFASRAITV